MPREAKALEQALDRPGRDGNPVRGGSGPLAPQDADPEEDGTKGEEVD